MESVFKLRNSIYNHYKNEHFFHFENEDVQFWFTVKDNSKNEPPFNRKTSIYVVYSIINNKELRETKIKGYIKTHSPQFWPNEVFIDIPGFYGTPDETSKIVKSIERIKELYVKIQKFFTKDFTPDTWQDMIPEKNSLKKSDNIT